MSLERYEIKQLKSLTSRQQIKLELLEKQSEKRHGLASATKEPRTQDDRITKRQDQHETWLEKLDSENTFLRESHRDLK